MKLSGLGGRKINIYSKEQTCVPRKYVFSNYTLSFREFHPEGLPKIWAQSNQISTIYGNMFSLKPEIALVSTKLGTRCIVVQDPKNDYFMAFYNNIRCQIGSRVTCRAQDSTLSQ